MVPGGYGAREIILKEFLLTKRDKRTILLSSSEM